MTPPQKQVLPFKLQKLTIKVKSFAFMRIFMKQSSSPMRCHKVRHYDLELQGASGIVGWLKKKLQPVYLRHLMEIKQWRGSNTQSCASLVLPGSTQQYIATLHLQVNSPSKKSVTSKIRCQTDRERHSPNKYSQNIQVQKHTQKVCRSEYGQESQLSQKSKKSNLQNLLQKVRQVNTQSKLEKENEQQKANRSCYQSYENSRVVSGNGGFVVEEYNGHYKKPSTTTRTKNYQSTHNDMSFCTVHPVPPSQHHHQKHSSTCRITDMKDFHLSGTPGDKMNSYNNPKPAANMSIFHPQEQPFDKNALLSAKRWHKSQKRNVIISKIKQLQNSLMAADYSRPEEYFFNQEDDFYYDTTNSNNMHMPTTTKHSNNNLYYETCYEKVPTNYSQAYLNYGYRQRQREQQQQARSVVDVRVVRK